MHRPGPQNSLLDVPGLTVGQAEDRRLKSGVTVVIPDEPAIASVVGWGRTIGVIAGTYSGELIAPGEVMRTVPLGGTQRVVYAVGEPHGRITARVERNARSA